MTIQEVLKNEPKGMFSVVTCPCCGKETLDNFYICECGWEYDGTTEPDKYSDANRSTINEFRVFSSKYPHIAD